MITEFKTYENYQLKNISKLKTSFMVIISKYVEMFYPKPEYFFNKYVAHINIFKYVAKYVGCVKIRKKLAFLKVEFNLNDTSKNMVDFLLDWLDKERADAHTYYEINEIDDKIIVTFAISNYKTYCEAIEKLIVSDELSEYVKLLSNVNKYNL